MSKVKIQGNASGTGVLTVTAPNTSTDRTITLPDSTDTLAVNSDVTNKLPLAGGTLTGNLNIGSYTANSNADNLVIQEAGDFTGITLAADNDQGSNIYFADPEDNNVGGITYNHSSNYMNFRVNGAEKLRIQSGGGISFNGDTAAANALNDYEEGTWTPQVKIDGSTTGITHDAQGGTYTKIGNTVILHAVLSLSSKGTETGAVTFANFPFTVENWTSTSSLDGGSICFGFYSGTNDISRLGGIAVGGTSTANLYRQTSDQSQLNDTMWETKIAQGFSTRWTLIYQTSA